MGKKGQWYRVSEVPPGLKESYPLHEVGTGVVVKALEDSGEGTVDVVDVETKGGLKRSVYSFQLQKIGAEAAQKYVESGGPTIRSVQGKKGTSYYYKLGIEARGRGYREAEIVAENDDIMHKACDTLLEGGTKVTILDKTRVPARGGRAVKKTSRKSAAPRLSR
jgi:hypothetical protein